MFRVYVEWTPTDHTPPDHELIQGLGRKELGAYRQFICKYYEFVYVIAFMLYCNEQKANEYVSAVMLHIWNNAYCLRPDCNVKKYLLDLITLRFSKP